jgi:type VI secretion system secreted protein VgrG
VTEAGLAAWDGSVATYVFRLEPHMITMARSSGYRTFLISPASSILSTLLGDAGLTPDIDNTARTIDWAIQWEESPLDFFNRLAEGEGYHYHFREEPGAEKVVLKLSNAGFTSIPGSFNYYGDLQDPGTGEEFIATFHERKRTYTGSAKAQGWDYQAKSAVSGTDSAPGGTGELQEFFADVTSADGLQATRAESVVRREQARRLENSATGNVAHLKAGHTFTLTDLTTAGYGGSYLVTGIRHYAVNDPAQSCASYGNAFTALPTTVDYRPPRRTHPPKVHGPVRAIVTANEDPDGLGRVKVKFPLDPIDDTESGWIRIARPAHLGERRLIPDVDDEVLVDFVRGDPSTPIVIGALYNGVDKPPHGSELYMVDDVLGPGGIGQFGCDDDPGVPGDQCPQHLYFYDDGKPADESLSWSIQDDRFELTNDLALGGQLSLGGGVITLDEDGPDGDQFIYFWDANSPVGQSFSWNNGGDQFDLTSGLRADGPIEAAAQFKGAALDVTGQVKGTSLDVGTGSIVGGSLDVSAGLGTITGSTLLDMGSGQIQAGQVSVGSGLISGGTIVATGIVQGATLSATGAIQGATSLTLPGPITLNGSDISQSGGLFSLAGGLSVGGDADLTGDLDVAGGDITASTLNIAPTSTLNISGNLVTLSGTETRVNSRSVLRWMIDSDNNTTASFAGWFRDGSYANASKIAELQENGNLRVRGSLTPFVSFDIAESFLAVEPVEPGDLVRLDPSAAGSVRLTEGEGDPLVIGVVSEKPGIVLGGGSFDEASLRSAWGEEVGALFGQDRARLREHVLADHGVLREALEAIGSVNETEDSVRTGASGIGTGETEGAVPGGERQDGSGAAELPGGKSRDGSAEERASARREIEERIEAKSLERFYEERFAPVALAGRVPVKADAAYGAIQPGDGLTPGPEPGVAVKATGPGPIVGTALEGLSAGRGMVLAFIHRGSHVPPAQGDVATTEQHAVSSEAGESTGSAAESIAHAKPPPMPAEIDQGVPFSLRRVSRKTDESGEEMFRVDAEGHVYARGAFHPASMDLAEYFPVSEPATVGDVLVVDPESPGRYGLGRRGLDPAVVGIVSGEPGVLLGSGISRILEADDRLAAELEEARQMGDGEREEEIWAALRSRFGETHAPVALSGTVLCKVDAGYGAIVPGDLLTTSATTGHAMRADDPVPGTIVGKALEPLADGTGTIKVLVMLR